MEEVKIYEFISRRIKDYKTRLDKKKIQAKSLSELKVYHDGIKTDILLKLEENWRLELTDLVYPEVLPFLTEESIEENFENQKALFKVHQQTDPIVKSDSQEHISAASASSFHDSLPSKSNQSSGEPVNKLINFWQNQQTDLGVQGPGSSTKTEYAIGIDLGTTMCCVGVVYKNQVEIVQNISQRNARTTPSYITFNRDGSDTFGYTAKETAYRQPDCTIYDCKRIIGRSWQDKELQKDMKLWPFEVVEENGNPKLVAGGRKRFPHEISARLLCRFKRMAEEHLNVPKGSIRKAVITVPAYFSEPQRRATYEAGVCAGLQILNVLNEPTAAAISYNWGKKTPGNRKALVYDFGGGTFDVSIAEVKGQNVQILCVGGDSHLGGQDIDQLLMEYCMKEFEQGTGIDLLADKDSEDVRKRISVKRAIARLRPKCEQAKEWLANNLETMVDVDCIADGMDLSVELSRDTLNRLCMPLIDRTLEIVQSTLEDAKVKGVNGKKDIDDIILVGGSTRLCIVEEKLRKMFPGKNICKSINPDEAVGHGAAIQADVLLRKKHFPKIVDVTPLTIGIECADDTVCRMIARNSTIPCSAEQEYSTSEDDQTSMRFVICQGESEIASENVSLGEFIFDGIPPAEASKEKILLKMTINAMGILEVKAVSKTTGMNEGIVITSNQLGMDEECIKQLTRELQETQI